MLAWHFGEITKAGERHRHPTPVCALILEKLRAIEETMFPNDDVTSGQQASADGGGDESADKSKTKAAPPYNRADLIMKDLLVGLQQLDYSKSSEIPTFKASETGICNDPLNTTIFTQHPTVAEWWFWISRVFAVVSLVLLLAFLFLHDY